ncbi:MAG: hypothetical protein RI947_872 [Candidatus Parcubacteria bacterium]
MMSRSNAGYFSHFSSVVEQRYRKPTMGVRFSQVAHMSRLEQHQQKQFRQKLIFSLVLLVAIFFVLFTFGFKILINTALFITNLTASKKNAPVTDTTETKYGLLDINNIPSATNSAQIIISGTVSNYDVLYFYVNDSKVKEKKVDSEEFSQEIGDLKKGTNTVYISAKSNDSKTEKKSPEYTVVYRGEKPKLDISEPQDNTKVSNSEVKVAGQTDKDILIKVNDFPVVVDAQGNFQTSVRLKEGDNPITIVAIDDAGNSETKNLKVVYQKD